MEASGEVVAVPDEQLGAGRDGLHRVEVNLHAVLTRRQVLLRRRVGRVDVPHPVRASLVQAVDEVVELTVRVDLRRRGRLVSNIRIYFIYLEIILLLRRMESIMF